MADQITAFRRHSDSISIKREGPLSPPYQFNKGHLDQFTQSPGSLATPQPAHFNKGGNQGFAVLTGLFLDFQRLREIFEGYGVHFYQDCADADLVVEMTCTDNMPVTENASYFALDSLNRKCPGLPRRIEQLNYVNYV